MAPKKGGLTFRKEPPSFLQDGGSFFIYAGLLFTLSLFLCSPVQIKGSTLSVSGDDILYDSKSLGLVASSDVAIVYEDHTAHTQHAIFDIPSQNIHIRNPFVYHHLDNTVTGSSMVYNFKTHEGHIAHVRASLKNILLTGKTIDVNTSHIAISHLTFTTCKRATPDYMVRSELVQLYPQVGFMVAFNNTLHSPLLPFPIWIPTYIYGSRSYSIIGSSSTIPEVGANNREGLYVKHHFGYFFNEASTGTVDLGWYIQRGGFLYGFTHLLETSAASEVHLKAHQVGQDGFEGLAAYYTDLVTVNNDNDKTENKDNSLFGNAFSPIFQNFKKIAARSGSRLHTGVTYRQFLNDSRVSQLPFAKLLLHDTEVWNQWTLSGDIGWASTKEETPTFTIHEDQNLHSQLSLGTVHALTPSMTLGSTLISNLNWYGNGETWQRLFASFYLDVPLIAIKPRLFYIKKLMQPYGQSPFEYERKYARVSDEVGLWMDVPLWGLEWGYEAFYDLERDTMRTQNIRTSFLFDCWKLSIKANTIEGNFSFDVELM